MKTYLHALVMCQSMFCAIPVPGNLWDEKARDKILLFLPVIGLEMGLIWAGIGWLCRYFALPALLTGLLLAVYPYLVSGFIHLDGFMDVSDAVGSCRTLERRREILKDSHVGSFAVIGCILLMLSQFVFFASVRENAGLWILVLVPVVSRCCSALAVTGLKPMSTSQYASQERPKSRLAVLGVMLAGAVAAGFLLFGRFGLVLVGEILGFLLALHRGYHSLEGMNGDISGYSLTCGELAAAAVLAFL